MPKVPIDYSKCLMYKLVCKDINIKNLYVGHTTNFNQRKYKHHYNLTNENETHYNCKVYQFIRENGGWEDWDMVMIEEYPCENLRQALMRERYWFETLKADLNSTIQIRTKEENKELEKVRGILYRQQQDKNEVKEYNRIYSEANAERLKQQKKDYYENNKEEINRERRANYENVKEKCNFYANAYREKNKDEINRRRREKNKLKKTLII